MITINQSVQSDALASLRSLTHAPKGFQIASFSGGFRLAARPLVAVATKTLAPSHFSSLPSFSLSSCHPYRNSFFLMFRLYLHLQILSQMPLPTMQTASGLYFRIFSSRMGVPAADSALLNSAASRLGRATILVFPMLYKRGRSTSCFGSSRTSVHPELCNSFQNKLLGWAYACPEVAVLTPGLKPTKTQIKFGSKISVRGFRCAYFSGGAYLLDSLRRLLGDGDASPMILAESRVRFGFLLIDCLSVGCCSIAECSICL